MYECGGMYLYEIIEDYKNAPSETEKNDIRDSFLSFIRDCPNKRRTYTKSIRFKIREDLLETPIGQVFREYSNIGYRYYKALSKYRDWRSLIRQKINNLYTRYFDSEVILEKEFMELIGTPKRLYCQWLKELASSKTAFPPDSPDAAGPAVSGWDAASLSKRLEKAMADSLIVKERLRREKMKLSWEEYQNLTDGFLKKCLDNCKTPDEYGGGGAPILDFLTEDNYYVKYICRSLDAYIKNYQKSYYNLKRGKNIRYKRCRGCGALIENDARNRQYCPSCKKEKRKQTNRDYYAKTFLKA